MEAGENVLYFARKEQCLALGAQLRTAFKPRIEDFKPGAPPRGTPERPDRDWVPLVTWGRESSLMAKQCGDRPPVLLMGWSGGPQAIFRVFPNGEAQYLHPKDGVFPEKVPMSGSKSHLGKLLVIFIAFVYDWGVSPNLNTSKLVKRPTLHLHFHSPHG